jgi:hypothetical protein
MSTVLTEGFYLSDFLFYEAPNLYSRDRVTVLSGQDLGMGAVVGIVTATGKAKALAPAAADGSQIAAGIMVADCDATTGDNPNGVMIARHAILTEAILWPVGITTPQKTTALAQLRAAGILVRAGA